MKKTAQISKNILLAVVLITVAALAFSKNAWAASGNVQVCQKDSTCAVGEFLYNDSYVPITSATCTFNSKYPNGDVFVNSQPMTSASANDGWYSYEVVATGSAGVYPSTVCCTAGADYLCLDKSFEIATASSTLTVADVANSVWNADRASHTASGSFGEIFQNIAPSASDIATATWGYSSRSLSTFGSLIADIWNNATRVLTGAGLSSGSLATKSDVDDKVNAKTEELKDEIKKVSTSSTQNITNISNVTTQITNLQESVEKIINKPVIETTSEEVINLGAKLNETEGVATQLFVSTQYANSKAGLIKLKWNSYENSEVLDSVQELTRKLGGENDSSSSSSVFGHISFLKESWDWSLVGTIKSQVKAVKGVLASIQSEVESSGRSKAAYSRVTVLVDLLSELDSSIGDISNKSSQETLFGKLKETRLLADSLDKREGDAKSLLSGWDKYRLLDKQRKLSDLSRKVVAINRIASVNKTLLSANSSLEKELKNKSYFVMGIISANKKLLARKTGLTLTSTWLELGSIVFKTLVTNPSTLISQKAALKYYLPPEIKKEDIIEADPGLTVGYDMEKNQYYVSGEFLLAPSETQTVSVRTQDIWVISKEKIDSLRKQAEELSRPLEKTSYFAQGVTIKSDIDVSLDKVVDLMKSNGTPEAKIRAFREAEIEMKAILAKTDKLKELVTQAGSTGTLFGFVGGTQTMAVWGLILILSVGFVFLALYMKLLVKQEEKEVVKKLSSVKEKEKPTLHSAEVKSLPRFRHALQLSIILLFFGAGAGLVSGVILGRTGIASSSSKIATEKTQEPKVLGNSSDKTNANEEVCKSQDEEKDEQSIKILVPLGDLINVRSEPSLSSLVITRLNQTSEFAELDRIDGWVQIALDAEKDGETYHQGWVSSEFAEKAEVLGQADKNEDSLLASTIIITDTPTGFLRVRQSPWGQEIAQVHPGDIFVPMEEKEDWYQIELQDGSTGWVYGQYVTENNS
ncbi:MAG: SH3 domain-containing protein [Candidatus Levybacteria bacterium]|nr:SH3 domain-containing protein [Candidatus Levybacteria bacterium]